MTEMPGDIWKLAHFLKDALVIPTNIGFSSRGEAVMKLGLAGQAAARFGDLRAAYGEFCMLHREATPLMRQRFAGAIGGRWLILFPTKPFNPDRPHMSWQGKADLQLIERGLIELAQMGPPAQGGKIWVPLLGCGRGGLRREPVRELMDKHLKAGHFVRVRPLH